MTVISMFVLVRFWTVVFVHGDYVVPTNNIMGNRAWNILRWFIKCFVI